MVPGSGDCSGYSSGLQLPWTSLSMPPLLHPDIWNGVRGWALLAAPPLPFMSPGARSARSTMRA